ncbi:ganglioside GM2 activator-like isoform X4 [Mya arenaria]|uniref:ganglioside GM2 activator-like isoform X4 n=1 Tax=Mya arenaria TaxID=6604 RepID=UPI0022E42516|nr:ganglioside GM2 activator-like isoform X4 [Mya arenaria]
MNLTSGTRSKTHSFCGRCVIKQPSPWSSRPYISSPTPYSSAITYRSPGRLMFSKMLVPPRHLRIDVKRGSRVAVLYTGACLRTMAHLKVMMKLDTQWFDVCVYKPEYCNINDVCDTMKLVVSDKCPPFLKRFCQCPFKKGNYPIPTLTKMVPNPPITVSGRFDITMTLTESQKEIGCLNVQLCLGQC